MPEEWLASTVPALNGSNSLGPLEGLSRVRQSDGSAGPLFRDLIAADPKGLLGSGRTEYGQRTGRADAFGVLCKFLDSAVRLPIQCHPDRDFARKHLRSEHGKAEAWLVLAIREVAGQAAYLLMGFKPGIRREEFAQAVREQDIATMEDMLNRVPAIAGDVWFIPGRFPHAVGPGVLMLEVQEPSDWVVQPERFCADFELPDELMWGPLDPETGLDCFSYQGTTADEMRARLFRIPRPVRKEPGGVLSDIIGSETTDCFNIRLLSVESEFILCGEPCYLAVIVDGSGKVRWDGGEAMVRRGDSFFVPYGVEAIRYAAGQEQLRVCLCASGRG